MFHQRINFQTPESECFLLNLICGRKREAILHLLVVAIILRGYSYGFHKSGVENSPVEGIAGESGVVRMVHGWIRPRRGSSSPKIFLQIEASSLQPR